MLSKEEIENKIKPIGEMLQDKINRLSEENFKQSQYIDQLETDKKKLIEKLVEDEYIIESTYSQINGNYFMAQDKLDYIREILSILKGEK